MRAYLVVFCCIFVLCASQNAPTDSKPEPEPKGSGQGQSGSGQGAGSGSGWGSGSGSGRRFVSGSRSGPGSGWGSGSGSGWGSGSGSGWGSGSGSGSGWGSGSDSGWGGSGSGHGSGSGDEYRPKKKTLEGVMQEAFGGLLKTAEKFLEKANLPIKLPIRMAEKKLPDPKPGYKQTYSDPVDQTQLEAFVVEPGKLDSRGKAPAVCIIHNADGRDEYEDGMAEKAAKLGYVGFAADLFGQGKSKDDNKAKMKELKDDRTGLMQRRLKAAYMELGSLPAVDISQVVAVGFSFGGTAVLDMARSGYEIKGVVNLYGDLEPPTKEFEGNISTLTKPAVLVLTGYDDPSIPPEKVEAFEEEMTEGKYDWQVHIFGNGTKHGFTIPGSADYHAQSDYRSIEMLAYFFEENLRFQY